MLTIHVTQTIRKTEPRVVNWGVLLQQAQNVGVLNRQSPLETIHPF